MKLVISDIEKKLPVMIPVNRENIFFVLMRVAFPFYAGGNDEEKKKQWAIINKQTELLMNEFEALTSWLPDGKGDGTWT